MKSNMRTEIKFAICYHLSELIVFLIDAEQTKVSSYEIDW